jgi:hypothetical protein
MKEVLSDILSYERKKLVLPVLMCLVLSFTLVMGVQFRSQGIDERLTSESVEMMTNLSVLQLKEDHFNESLTASERRSLMPPNQSYSERNFESLRWEAAISGSMALYRTPLFMMVPESENFATTFWGDSVPKALPFKYDPGFRYITKESPESLALIQYRSSAITNLSKRVNSSESYTLEQVEADLDRIRSVEPYDRAIVENYGDVVAGSSSISRERQVQKIREGLEDGVIKEIQLYHFIPTYLATFVFWYLLSGGALSGYRRSKLRLRSN